MALGTLTAPWGLRGELKVRLDAEPDVVRRTSRVYVGRDRQPYDLVGLYKHGRAYTVRLAGVETIDAAETLRNAPVAILRADAPALPPGHYFVDQIVGLPVLTTDGQALGRVVEVLSTGANDVYVVQGKDETGAAREVLVPAIRDVVTIDIAAGVVHVEPVAGLLDPITIPPSPRDEGDEVP